MRSELQPSFIEKVKQRLQRPLPGEDAQYKMAPTYRPKLEVQAITSLHPRLGGVLILLYQKDDDWFIVFTQRRVYDGIHSGQMSFPGGKADDFDSDIVQTALREAEEEIGIITSEVEVLGKLTELYIPPSNFLVQPVVAHLIRPQIFIPHEREVQEVVEIPVSFFLGDENIHQTPIVLQHGMSTTVPAFVYKERYIIWGATAIILSEFREIVREVMQ